MQEWEVSFSSKCFLVQKFFCVCQEYQTTFSNLFSIILRTVWAFSNNMPNGDNLHHIPCRKKNSILNASMTQKPAAWLTNAFDEILSMSAVERCLGQPENARNTGLFSFLDLSLRALQGVRSFPPKPWNFLKGKPLISSWRGGEGGWYKQWSKWSDTKIFQDRVEKKKV